MRLIPVIDLLDGRAVHAIRGEREKYRPVKSVLCNTPDPKAIVRAFRDVLGLNELYIADLNAIRDSGRTCHHGLIAHIARHEGIHMILDAGMHDEDTVRSWLRLGIQKAVIGAETLRRMEALREIPRAIEPDRLVFSLDMHNGTILSGCPEVSSLLPMAALEIIQSAGWQEVILLDLRRVGSGEGVDRALIDEARSRFPGLRLLAGGGIAKPEQLADLQSLGIEGVLVATALHQGIITAQHIKNSKTPRA